MKLKRTRYQHGSLTTEKRKTGPDVYVYRWREGRVKRKQILGSVKGLTKTQAQRKAEEYRKRANTSPHLRDDTSFTVAELAEHYSERELCESSGQ